MNNSIVNNTIEKGWSDGDITINNYFNDAPPGVPVNNLVSGNTISLCGLNGIAIVSGTGNIVQNNALTDCNIDVEPNDGGNGPVFANLVKGNSITKLNRPGVEAIGQGFRDDQFGRHYVLFFSSCAKAPCDLTGGDTIAVIDNTFIGNVEILTYCRGGRVTQIWANNITRIGSQACTLNTSGCAYAPSYSCSPAPGTNIDQGAISIINSILLDH